MKLALVHYSLPPVVGGVEKIVSQHARLFARHGHEVTVICERGGEPPPGGHLVRYLPATEEAALHEFLHPALAEQAVVFIHNVGTMPFDLALTSALWRAAETLPAVRFISWIHDMAACNPDYRLPPLTQHPWSLLAKAHPRMEFVAVSDLRARQWIELTGIPRERCRVIPNGVDPTAVLGFDESFAAWERQHEILDRDFVLLHPTRLLRRKNVELGLRVSAAIKAAGRSVAYLVTAATDPHQTASTDYAADVLALRDALGLGTDALFGRDNQPITDRELPQFFAVADALFFPSRQEGFGLPMLEAALHRLPVFCADIEPLHSLPNQGVTRFPLDADPARIAAALMRQLDASPAIQARKAVVRDYAWPAVYRNFLAPLLAES